MSDKEKAALNKNEEVTANDINSGEVSPRTGVYSKIKRKPG
jgi:hypothetical protein